MIHNQSSVHLVQVFVENYCSGTVVCLYIGGVFRSLGKYIFGRAIIGYVNFLHD